MHSFFVFAYSLGLKLRSEAKIK